MRQRILLYDDESGEVIENIPPIVGTEKPIENVSKIGVIVIPEGELEDEFSRVECLHVDIVIKQIVFDKLKQRLPTYEELENAFLEAKGVI